MSPVFDQQDQLDKIEVLLLKGETIIAVYNGHGAEAGFVGLTDHRVVVQDNSFVQSRAALTSVPYGRVDTVSFVSDTTQPGQFTFSSSVGFSAAGKVYVIQLSDGDKASHVHEVILRRMGTPAVADGDTASPGQAHS